MLRSFALTVISVLLLPCEPATAGVVPDCDPSPKLSAVAPLEQQTRACGREAACLEKAQADWRALLASMPLEVRAHRGYIRAWRAVDPSAVQAAYKAQAEARPQDPLPRALYGYALGNESGEAQLAAYREALALDGTYGWAHWFLARVYLGREGESSRDLVKAKPHIRGWLEACPVDEDGMRMAASVGDKSFGQEMLAAARPVIEKATGEWVVRRYESLWQAELKAARFEEREAVRERIRADLARLRPMNLDGSRHFWRVLDLGYSVVRDPAARATVRQELNRRFPCEPEGLTAARALWDDEHPLPPAPAPAVIQERYRGLYRLWSERTGRCPDNALAWQRRLSAASRIDDLDPREVEASADGLLAAAAQPAPVRLRLSEPPYAEIAEIYLHRGVRLEQVPALIDKARSETTPAAIPAGLAEKERLALEAERRQTEWHWAWLRARALNALGRAHEREAGVAELEKLLSAESDSENERLMRAQLGWLRGEVAAREGRWADAFARYQSARAEVTDAVLRKSTEAAWARLGGTPAGLEALDTANRARAVARPSRWRDAERPLPAAKLMRSGGGEWTLADFQGKRTLVSIWATWCPPCLDELPGVQKLHQKLAGRNDLAVVTFNVDEDVAAADAFVKKSGYTFPVVFANDYWNTLDIDTSVPTNWIVDERGVVRLESRGFGGDGAGWLTDAVARLEPAPGSAGAN